MCAKQRTVITTTQECMSTEVRHDLTPWLRCKESIEFVQLCPVTNYIPLFTFGAV